MRFTAKSTSIRTTDSQQRNINTLIISQQQPQQPQRKYRSKATTVVGPLIKIK